MKSIFLIFSALPLLFLFASCKKEAPGAPEENRFTKEVLAGGLNEPLELAILPGGNVLFIERYGTLKIYDQQKNAVKVVDTIPVRHGYTDDKGQFVETEEGLLGMQIDPDFEKNNFVYFYCSPAGTPAIYALLRYELRDEKLVRASRKVVLEIPVEPQLGWRPGGSIDFDGQGNLFLSIGDDTDYGDEGEFAPIDERPGHSRYDAQRTAGNTNDLRGHILRIHPEPDGSYTIPEGNLFPKGMAKTRPEIYAMGNRNPFRISVDRKTGYLYWGNVGPDAFTDSITLGPMGYDELNQAKKAGNFGWPYFTGGNRPYVEYDYATQKSGANYDTDKGASGIPGIRSEQVIVLRNAANIPAAACDEMQDIQIYDALNSGIKWRVAQKTGAYITYKGIDLTGIGVVTVMGIAAGDLYEAGGVVEVRLGSPTGTLIGSLPIELRPMGPPVKYTTLIKPQTGKHDVYFVCKNDKAAAGQDLFMLSQMAFEMTRPIF